jgi:hypothetical protein
MLIMKYQGRYHLGVKVMRMPFEGEEGNWGKHGLSLTPEWEPGKHGESSACAA